jgi:catechol 2,3-dioxygenase-like lactoylglutathione lyase family enzyme
VLLSDYREGLKKTADALRSERAMNVYALTLIVLRCADVERSRKFYEALGLVGVAEQHGQGPLHYSITIGQTVLELYPRRGAGSRGLRFGLLVSDVAAAASVVERAGGKVVRAEAAQIPSAVVEDPDGHTIELTQPSP